MARENTSSGKFQEPAGHESNAGTVGKIMMRQEQVQTTAKGGKFQLMTDNLAHHASKKPEPTV
jgi:hypothetical protein